MGLTSIKGAMDALNNTDLTFFEKFSRVSMGFSMGISQLAAGFPVLTKGITALGGGLATVIPGLSGTGAAATIAAGGLSGVALAAGIVVAAIGAVTAVVLGLKWAWESFTPEGKFAVAKKEAEEAKKAYEESKNAVIDFKTTYDDWSALYEKTKTLTKYTDEYREAIIKADEAALELIKKYDLIKDQDWFVDENGHIVINSESKQRALNRDSYTDLIESNNAEIEEQHGKIGVAAKNAAQTESIKQGPHFIDITGQDFLNEYLQLANHYLKNGEKGLPELYTELGLRTAGKENGGYNEQLPEIIKLAEQIQQSNAIIDTLTKQNEIAQAKLDLGNNYSDDFELLLNKFLGEEDSKNHKITGQDIADTYNKYFSSISSKDIDDSTKKQLANVLAEAELQGSKKIDLSGIDISSFKDKTIEELQKIFGNDTAQLIQDAINRSSEQIDTEQFVSNFEEIHKIINKLSNGDIIDSANYDKLYTANKEISDYFVKMSDGTYKLVGDAKEFYDLVNGQQTDQAQKKIEQLHQENLNLDKANARLTDKNGNRRYLDSEPGQEQLFSSAEKSSVTDSTTGKTTNYVLSDQIGLLSDLQYDQEKLDQWAENGYSKEDMQEIADALSQYKDALIAKDDAQKKNIETEQEYANNIAISANSLEDLNEKTKSFSENEDINATESYNQGLMALAAQYTNTTTELTNYKNALKEQEEAQKAYDEALLTSNDNLIKDTEEKLNNAKAASVLAKNNLELSAKVGEVAKKYNLNAEEIESLTKEFNYLAKKVKKFLQ